MRVVLVPSSYAPHIGGIEEVTRQLARRLREAGDEVEVWTHRHPATLPAREDVDGVSVLRFPFPLPAAQVGNLVRWPVAAVATQVALARQVRRFRPQVLHVHGFSGNGVHATMASAVGRIPLIITLHGETSMDDHDIYDRSLSLRTGLRWGQGRAAAVTAPSRFILDDARRFSLPEGRARVIPNGVDPQEAVAGAPPVVPFGRFVLALGRLVPNKGFDLLLRAFAPVVEDRPELGLVIAGDGPHKAELVALADGLGIGDQVWFPGWLDRGEVASIISRAAVFALPSRLEPFGIVVLEAMHAGTPVVASARGGVAEWARDGRDLLIVDPLQIAQFSATLARILDDPGLAAALAAEGRRHAARFDWGVVSEEYRRLYAELVA